VVFVVVRSSEAYEGRSESRIEEITTNRRGNHENRGYRKCEQHDGDVNRITNMYDDGANRRHCGGAKQNHM
jgi:hypothetical protein